MLHTAQIGRGPGVLHFNQNDEVRRHLPQRNRCMRRRGEPVGHSTECGRRVVPCPVPLRLRETALANVLEGPTELAAMEDHRWHTADLAQLTVPVYPMVGSTSPPFNSGFTNFVAEHIPDTQVQGIEGGNLGTPIDDPAKFDALLAQLRRQVATSAHAARRTARPTISVGVQREGLGDLG